MLRISGRVAAVAAVLFISVAQSAQSQVTGFMQGVAEAASGDRAVAQFYRANGYQPIWTGNGRRDKQRREALLDALEAAGDHGLPASTYDLDPLRENLRRVQSERELGRIEVRLSQLFLEYAEDMQSGILDPERVISDIKRDRPMRSRFETLSVFAKNSPKAFFRGLPPQHPEYERLLKAKLDMERVIGRGGWGPKVSGRMIRPGESGANVVSLRNRLIAMGYLNRSSSQSYGKAIEDAVRAFQEDHGLAPDGVAGPGTIQEINVEPEQRLASIIVAMERERWMNYDRGDRHIWVNLPDFSVQVIEGRKVVFESDTVIGANRDDWRSPEFSDSMDHMVINPSWNVPRSIAVKEYLPLMQENPQAAGHLTLLDQNRRPISREGIDFTQYTPETFPFDLKQPPSDGNALGLVKFMFPNANNIYLHDTPEKQYFGREVRAFSHGCIRVAKPFDFAYELLSAQERDPKAYFAQRRQQGMEQVVGLHDPVPIHLVYRTAIAPAQGRINFRRDVYGRDGRIFNALSRAGVELRGVRS
ncbi:MAG: L,D-transpeptidase family protein [Rhodobacteraceae bacterium]|nr:L,D-transpeptidase family protein [Paracoccaceae bacterium]